jgi:hypothetical protein
MFLDYNLAINCIPLNLGPQEKGIATSLPYTTLQAPPDTVPREVSTSILQRLKLISHTITHLLDSRLVINV